MAEPDVTPRQLAVLSAYLDADSGREAAHRLGITPSRARKLMSQLYRRLGVHNAAQATALLDERFPGWRAPAS